MTEKLLVMTKELWLGLSAYSEWVKVADVRAAMTEVDLDELRKDTNIQDITGTNGAMYADMREFRASASGYNRALDDLLAHMEGK